MKVYWAKYQDCKTCPLKSTCIPTTNRKNISRTAYDPHYKRAYERQHSIQGRRMKKIRQSTIEPVFGSLICHYGMRQIGVKRKPGAHKVMLMASIAFNIKKYMKFISKKITSQIMDGKAALETILCLFMLYKMTYNTKGKK